jgi:LPS export ABC transporter protein LptC
MGRGALPFLLPLLAALAAGCGGNGNGNGNHAANGSGSSGPELAMTGMAMTEVQPSGVHYRLDADRATYAFAGKTVTATGVTFGLREHAGEVRVTAPTATWNVAGQSAVFPEGCVAEYPGGYSAQVPSAEVDLKRRVLTAAGPATFAGPGFTMTGVDFVWRWRDGKADLRQPKTVIVPAGMPAMKRG